MQTRTKVDSYRTAAEQRSMAGNQNHRAMCTLMLYTQAVLYGTLTVLPKAGNASWWLAGTLVIPALAAFGLVKWSCGRNGLSEALFKGLGARGRGVAGILYALLLGFDVCFALSGLTELTASFVIEEGGVWQLAPWGAAAGIAGVWLGHEMGAARCCYLLRWLLTAVLVGCVIAALPMGDASFLFPWQFESLEQDLSQGLLWSGSLWPMVLMGDTSGGARGMRCGKVKMVLFGIGTVLLLFFGYCFVLPAEAFLRAMTWGERMVVFLRATSSKLMWELLLVMKMTVLLLNICAGAALAGQLIRHWTCGKAHPCLWASALILLSIPAAADHTRFSQQILIMAAPWRLPAALLPVAAAGVGMRIRERREVR